MVGILEEGKNGTPSQGQNGRQGLKVCDNICHIIDSDHIYHIIDSDHKCHITDRDHIYYINDIDTHKGINCLLKKKGGNYDKDIQIRSY